MNDDQILEEPKVNINALQFSARFKSKTEVFYFLTVECHAYLPKCSATNIFWMKKLIDGSLKVSMAKSRLANRICIVLENQLGWEVLRAILWDHNDTQGACLHAELPKKLVFPAGSEGQAQVAKAVHHGRGLNDHPGRLQELDQPDDWGAQLRIS